MSIWIKENDVSDISIFLDAHSFMGMMQTGVAEMNDMLSAASRTQPSKVANLLEARLFTSFQNPIPPILGDSSSYHPIPNAKTYEIWEAPSKTDQGLRFQLEQSITTVTQMIESNINVHPNIAVRSLAHSFLAKSEQFQRKWGTFITDNARKLCDQGQFPLEKSYELSSQCARAVIDKLASARSSARYSLGNLQMDRQLGMAQALFAIFRTQLMTAEFVNLQFENHPVVTARLTHFLVSCQSARDGIALEEFEKLKAQTEQARAEAKRINSRVDAVNSRTDVLDKRSTARRAA